MITSLKIILFNTFAYKSCFLKLDFHMKMIFVVKNILLNYNELIEHRKIVEKYFSWYLTEFLPGPGYNWKTF